MLRSRNYFLKIEVTQQVKIHTSALYSKASLNSLKAASLQERKNFSLPSKPEANDDS